MRKKLILGLFLGFFSNLCHAANTPTARIGLQKPAIGDSGWGITTNSNWDIIDASAAMQSLPNTFMAANTFTNISSTTFTNVSTITIPNPVFVDIGNLDTVKSVIGFGALCNGLTDDTVAIQTAINSMKSGGKLLFPAGNCVISSTLTLASNVIYQGGSPSGSYGGTTLTMVGSNSIFSIPAINTGNTGEYPRLSINNFTLQGGFNGIYDGDGAIWVNLNQVFFNNPSNACIYMRGSNQHWFVRDSILLGGNYGIYLTQSGIDVNGNAGSTVGFDKNAFENCEIGGQAVNAIHIDLTSGSGTGGANSFTNVLIDNVVQDGAVFAGGLTGLIFTNCEMESNGLLQTQPYGYPVEGSTATTSVGFSTITVGTTAGLSIGQTVTIQGAGANGIDWTPVITQVFTSSITVNATAPTTVINSEITNYLYSDFKFLGGAMVTITNFNGGSYNSGAATRYAIDATGASGCVINNVSLGRPIYDPSGVCTTIGSNASMNVRRPYSYIVENFGSTYFGGYAHQTPRTQIVSPSGGDIVLGFQDSTQNQSGTFGNFFIRRSDGNRTQVFSINASSGTITGTGPITTTGYVQPGSLTSAQIMATVPVGLGQIYMCSNCSSIPACVSTGTLVNQWGAITNKGLACQ